MYHELYTNYIQTIYDETAGVPATTEQFLLSYPLTHLDEATQLLTWKKLVTLVTMSPPIFWIFRQILG